jgi:hypothetical protein
MVLGHSLFKIYVGKQFTRPYIRTAHRSRRSSQRRNQIRHQMSAVSIEFFSSLLVLLSQKVAGFVEKNHVFGKIRFSACGGLRWVCQHQVTLHRGFRGMSRV